MPTSPCPEPIAPWLAAWEIVLSYREHINDLARSVDPDFCLCVAPGPITLVWPTFSYELPPFAADLIVPDLLAPWCQGHYDGAMFLAQQPPESPAAVAAYQSGYALGEAQARGEPVGPVPQILQAPPPSDERLAS